MICQLTNVFEAEPSRKLGLSSLTGCCKPTQTIPALILEPGDSTCLNMQFTIPEDKAGPQDCRVHVIINDPKSPDLSLKVLSNWVP